LGPQQTLPTPPTISKSATAQPRLCLRRPMPHVNGKRERPNPARPPALVAIEWRAFFLTPAPVESQTRARVGWGINLSLLWRAPFPAKIGEDQLYARRPTFSPRQNAPVGVCPIWNRWLPYLPFYRNTRFFKHAVGFERRAMMTETVWRSRAPSPAADFGLGCWPVRPHRDRTSPSL